MTAVTEKALSLLGLARRGGNAALGEEPVSDACARHKARAVFLAADAGETIVRRAHRMTDEGNAPLITLPATKAEVGFALGRSTCAVLAVTDQGLACAVVNALAQEDGALKEIAEQMTAKTRRQMLRRDKKKSRAENKPAEA